MSGAVHAEDEAKKAEEYLLGKAFEVRDIFSPEAFLSHVIIGLDVSLSPNSPLFIQHRGILFHN